MGFVPGLGEEAHNHYLKVFLDSGIFGLVAFIWLLARVVLVARQAYKKGNFTISKVIGFTAFTATIGLSISAFFQDVFKPVILNELWWVLVGLTCAAYRIEQKAFRKEKEYE